MSGRRTRREKELARLRRLREEGVGKIAISDKKTVRVDTDPGVQGGFVYDADRSYYSEKTTNEPGKELFSHVKNDLFKTLVLSGLAFSLELCLYWGWEKGGWQKLIGLVR